MSASRRSVPTVALAVVTGAVAALTVVSLAVVERGRAGPGTVELRARWSAAGRTELALPPLGRVSAATHGWPLVIEARVERAPDLLAAARRQLGGVAVVRGRLAVLSRRVAQLYQAVPGDGGDPDGEVRILHVSDIHSNPLGLEVARRLATDLQVDAVVDTGNLTSFGRDGVGILHGRDRAPLRGPRPPLRRRSPGGRGRGGPPGRGRTVPHRPRAG